MPPGAEPFTPTPEMEAARCAVADAYAQLQDPLQLLSSALCTTVPGLTPLKWRSWWGTPGFPDWWGEAIALHVPAMEADHHLLEQLAHRNLIGGLAAGSDRHLAVWQRMNAARLEAKANNTGGEERESDWDAWRLGTPEAAWDEDGASPALPEGG